MTIRSRLKNVFRQSGYSIERILPSTDSWARRIALINSLDIEMVIDIGAHVGGYGKQLRQAGFLRDLVSFEPQKESFEELVKVSKKYQPWKTYDVALSDFDGTTDLFVERRSSSSSLQKMSNDARRMASTELIAETKVKVNRLDSLHDEIFNDRKSVYLKCDAQGAEQKIFDGAERILKHVDAVELELSIAEMYEGQWNFREALDWFADRGFELFSIEAGFADPQTGRVMQVDGIFCRTCRLSS